MSVAKDTLLSLLLSFKPEFAHLAELEKAAVKIYGENWQEALNRDIIAMPARERDEYLPRWKVALAYEGAVKLWRRAEQVLGGSLPASMEAVGDIGKYDATLPRFGKLGEQMLVRLRLKLGLPPTASPSVIPARPSPVIPAPDDGIRAIRKPTAKKIKIKKTVLARKKKQASLPIAPGKDTRLDWQPSTSSRKPISATWLDGSEAAKIKTKRTSFSDNFDEAVFERLEEFVAESREVMAMLVLDGKHGSIEEYPHYGFIIDATRALAEKAESLGLAEKAHFYGKALENEMIPVIPVQNAETEHAKPSRRVTLRQPQKKLAKPKKKS